MRKFKIVPLSKEYAAQVRSTGKDAFGHAVIEQIATGLGPCRVSSHSPFGIDNPYNQPGPVFINKEEVEEYTDVHRFPPEIKANKKSFPFKTS